MSKVPVKFMLLSDCLKHNEDVIAQQAGDSLILFHMNTGQYYSLNELGARIWELCDGSRSLSELIGQLEDEYDAPSDVIHEDSQALTASLMENNLLIIRRGNDAIPV